MQWTLTALAVWLAAAAGQEPRPAPAARQSFHVAPALSPIRVDGVLDEAAWTAATAIPIAYEWDPGDNAAAPERTDCLVTFDERNLYVAFRAADKAAARIRANLTDRDAATQDDTVGFMLDPFDDERRAFQFRINPVGVQMDAINSDVDESEDFSWDAIWDAKGRIAEDGYVVEVAVPFSSLRFPRTEGAQTWGFLATRDLPRSARHRLRSARTDRDRDCLVCQFDKLSGFQGMKPGLNLELDPTLTAHRTDLRPDFPAGPFEAGELDADPGLTARWSATPNLILNLAANPDFSQVEADVAQLDVNTRFALFFPERRPLFLEGADFFSTPISTVFTRTIADPSLGVKLTGKEGRNAVGVFVVRDEISNYLIPGNQGSSLDSSEQANWTGVLRFRRDVGKGSNLGVMLTSREGEAYHNRQAGLDGVARVSQADTLRGQLLVSSTEYPEALALDHDQKRERFSGLGYSAGYTHQTRDWYWQATAAGLSPGYRSDTGFEPRVDLRIYQAGAERTVWGGSDRWFNRLLFGAFYDRAEDWRGGQVDQGADLLVTYVGPLQSELSYNAAPNKEYFEGHTYDNFRHNLDAALRPSGALHFTFSGTVGKTVDFANSRQADLLRLTPTLELSLARRLTGTLSHRFERLRVPEGRVFTARLSEARVVLHFDTRALFRVILQYVDVDRNTVVYRDEVEPRTRELFSQLLFSYKLNPQTLLLLGYSDNALGQRGVDLTRSDRTFFFKIGYAWVL